MHSSIDLSLSFFVVLAAAGIYLLYQMVRIVPQGEEGGWSDWENFIRSSSQGLTF